MARLCSFRDVIAEMFYNGIFNALAEYVEKNPEKLDSNSRRVECPDEAELSDIEIKFVNVTKSEGIGIFFDVIVSAEIKIGETIKRDRETDGVEQWFRISCYTELEVNLKNFCISTIRVYDKYQKANINSLSEHLVPIIPKSQLDAVAEKFLTKYYPEALTEPKPIPAHEVAKRMGLVVQHAHITKNWTVFGQIYFADSEIHCYDRAAKVYKPFHIRRGTIVIDPDVYFMRTVGSVNNTIIHECVHWELHKKFFELEKLYNKEARSISCQVQENSKSEKNRTPLDWMEWQANVLAPRILMPAKQTRQKIEELIDKNQLVLGTSNMADLMESVVFELADFFEVSRQAAKIRMIDLGYKEALGVYTYIDDRYIANHSFERKALGDNQTFSIGIQDALYEYATNEEFKKLLDSGKYIYVDAHFCIDDSKYVRRNAGGYAELTDYARQHVDECCLVFDLKARKNDKFGIKSYTECVLFRDLTSDKIIEAKYSKSFQNSQTEARAEKLRKIKEEAFWVAAILNGLPASFSGTLVAHMDRLDCTVEKLEEKSLINSKTIQRMRNSIKYDAKLPTIVAICIGLQLNPIFSADMIKKAGYAFKIDEEHIIYQMLLNSHYQNSIHECNEILRENGCKTLGREE